MPRAKKSSISSKRSLITYGIVTTLVLGTGILITQVKERQQTVSLAAGDCTVSAEDMKEHPDEQKFIKALNEYRAKNGVKPIKLSHEAKKPAQWYANELAQAYVSNNHADKYGRKAMQRFEDCGMTINSYSENKSPTSKSVEEVIERWGNDEGHRKNLLSDNEVVGLGRKNDVWVADFVSGLKMKNAPAPAKPTADTNTVPSPQCLGPCPTTALNPAVSSSPTTPLSPPVSLSQTPVIVPTPMNNTTPGPMDIVSLFLQVILSLFQKVF